MSVKLKELRESFFKTVFTLLGHIANCDGYVNREEIKRTQVFMEKMKLTPECKREAIVLFRDGSSPRFNMAELLREFSVAAERTPSIIEVLLVYLISLARIDGLLVEKEIKVVREVAAGLGYSNIIFNHLLKMVAAQDKFEGETHHHSAFKSHDSTAAERKSSASGKSQSTEGQRSWQNSYSEKNNNSSETDQSKKNGSRGTQGQDNYFTYRNSDGKNRAGGDLVAAYEALNVSMAVSDDELKKSYRKLVSQFHPDKLQGQGLPPELINTATDRFKKIQGAYDYIRKHRLK